MRTHRVFLLGLTLVLGAFSALCIVVLSVPAMATTVTGSLLDASGSSVSNARVVFQLINYGTGNAPRISGTGVIADMSPIDATVSSNGTFTATVQGNDTITPSGTRYRVTFIYNGSVQYRAVYDVTGSALDLNSAAPEASLPATSQVLSATQMPALTGDVTSSAGSTAVTVNKVNGVSYAASPAIDTLPLITAANTASYTAMPNCADVSGQHLNYDTSTHAFSCGTSGSGGGSYTGCTGATNGIGCTGQLEAGTYLKADANAAGVSVENLQTATVADLSTITTTNASILATGSTLWVSDAASCGDTTTGGGSVKELLQVTGMSAGSPTGWAVLQCYDPSTSVASSSMVPASIPNLVLWVSGDRTHWTNGGAVPYWNDAYTGNVATSNAGATYATGAINTLPAFSFPGSSSGRYTIKYPINLSKATIFLVLSPSGSGAYQSILSGTTNSLELRIDPTSHLVLTQDYTADIASDTTALTTSTWYQVNATYNSSTGNYAFRVNEAASSSGTVTKTITASTSGLGYDVQANAADANCQIAEIIIYNRVLTGPEITSVETYLNSKYGI